MSLPSCGSKLGWKASFSGKCNRLLTDQAERAHDGAAALVRDRRVGRPDRLGHISRRVVTIVTTFVTSVLQVVCYDALIKPLN